MDYWALAFPRFVQGLGQGFTFVPLQTLALATVPMARLSNATAAYSVVRNFGGSMGIALATTLLARRSQYHQATLGAHVTVWDPETAARLKQWTGHFIAQGADGFTAERRPSRCCTGARRIRRRSLPTPTPTSSCSSSSWRSSCCCPSCAGCGPTRPGRRRRGPAAARPEAIPEPAD